jgi:hypothetical protein
MNELTVKPAHFIDLDAMPAINKNGGYYMSDLGEFGEKLGQFLGLS